MATTALKKIFKPRCSANQRDFSLDNIRLLIGETEYNQLFGEGGTLFGFNNIDPIILLNNQNVSVNYLLQMIQKLNENEIEIINVESE